jgi:Uncharacterised nucleotidyltransferase
MSDEINRLRLALALRDRRLAPPPKDEWPALLAAAEDHGVVPLLLDAIVGAGDSAPADRWDTEAVLSLRAAAAAQTAVSIARERELQTVLTSLAAAGIEALIIKGSHLAFAVYPSPERRPHLDTDLLIKQGDRNAVKDCLAGLGYVPVPNVTGDVAFAQVPYSRTDRSGARHTLDVHWRIANPHAFAYRLTMADLARGAMAISRLGPHACGPSLPLALLVACVHRTAHHGTSHRLIWLYDIHLIAMALREDDWMNATDMAIRRGLGAVLARGLEHASATFGTPVPVAIVEMLSDAASQTDADVLAFLQGPRSRIAVAASDWRRLRGLRDRARFLREHLFPPPSYMSYRYGTTSHALLPVLYAHRLVTGAGKWAMETLRSED